MKKSDLTNLITEIVAVEVRKQLPNVIAEVFSKLMPKVSDTQPQPAAQQIKEQVDEQVSDEQISLNASLSELLSGGPPQRPAAQQQRPQRRFSKNPILNEVLNNTTSDLASRERMYMSPAAYMASSMSPDMYAGQQTNVQFETVNPNEPSPSYLNNVPSMETLLKKTSPPPVLSEGQESSYAPMQNVPACVSVLDLKQHAPAAVSKALTRNYSQFLKLMDKKKSS